MNIALKKIPDREVNTLPGLSNLEGVVRASEPKSILMLEADYVLRMIARIHQADALTKATIALAWSERGAEAQLLNLPNWQRTFDDWAIMHFATPKAKISRSAKMRLPGLGLFAGMSA